MKPFGIALILISVLFSSCNDSSKLLPEDVKNTILEGDWVVSYLRLGGTDETSDFKDVVFDFQTDGLVIANESNDLKEGEWSVSLDEDTDECTFYMNFTINGTLEEISDIWQVEKLESGRLKLLDEDGENGSTDYLTFEKQ